MTSPTPRLTLQLLGLFQLASKGVSVDLAYEKGRALLAFLAMQAGRSFTRAYLAELLWPNLERTTGLANLRQVLHNLRPLINGASDAHKALLQISRDTVALQVDERIDVDAIGFLAPTTACTSIAAPGYCTDCLTDMALCAALYQGEFLQGFSLPDCPEFEDWLLTQREVVLQRSLTRLAQLSDAHEHAGAYAQALPFAQRFLALDPWNEHGSRRVMRLLAQCAQHDAALSHFDRWCRVVQEELGLLPSEETRTLAEHIRNHALPQKGRRSTDSASPVSTAPIPRAQRRQVTVLHCALEVGGDDDPDAAMARLHGPQQRCGDIIRAYAGYLVQAHGGSLLAYFGYPHAFENSARQAVRAGLALRNEGFTDLALRMGVHTGMVISGGEPDVPDAIGAASNVAIRLRQQLEDGEIAISRATHRLVAGYFECTRLPGDAYRVVQESGARDRLEAADQLTPLIGRSQELEALLGLWQQTSQGSPRAVLLQGHAGIGKSRLVLELKQALNDTTFAITELRCVPEYSQTPFHPLVALFQATMGFVATDSALVRAQKLAQYVQAEYPGAQADVHALLANLLSLPLSAPANDALTTSPRQRERTLQIVLDRLYTMAQPRPVLLVVEDLHWADPSSLELLKRIINHQRAGCWMAVMTARPDFSPPWEPQHCSAMPLDALNGREARALVDAVLPGVAPAVAHAIVDRADGIPLFVEELAKELSDHNLSTIPSTLQDLLTARLDALGTAKVVAQQAATIGRVFTLDFLCRIANFDEKAVNHALRQLCSAGLLHRVGPTAFQFGHALLRDAAYQSQTRPEREATHLRIAKALQPDADVRPELLAQHWTAGGQLPEAARCWLAASQLARQQSAHQEAILHCQSGLALLAQLPDDVQHKRLECDLQIKLGASLCATQGYTCAPGAAAYTRAMALCADTQQEPHADLFIAMWGLWASASQRVDYHHSHELAQQLQRVAQRHGDPIHIQQASFAQGVTHFRQGRLQDAYSQFQCVQGLYAPAQHASHVARFGEDVGVTNGSHLSGVLWLMGYAEQSLHTSAQTVAYARQLEHPYSLAYALTYAMLLHCNWRQPAACLALAEETLALAQQHGFALWQMGATLLRGWAMAQLHIPQGLELMQHCVHATRSALGSVEVMALEPLAQACVSAGRADLALVAIDEAFATSAAKADYHLDAELHRLQGEALLMQSPSNVDQAVQFFETALRISQQQHAKVFELRAAISLGRLWKKKRKSKAAQALLAGVVGSFSEGFDSPDLHDARQLLEQLTPS
jgi:DNA-binding SARP family transcriptional activator